MTDEQPRISTSKAIICKYCLESENKIARPCLECKKCGGFVHKHCLKSLSTPGGLLGDIFFAFTCLECSPTNTEVFIRHKVQWLNMVVLVIYNLMQRCPGISNKGFYHWKTHIAAYIDNNWSTLFGKTKRKKNWMGTVSGMLSHYTNTVFVSGSSVLMETGWWKLANGVTPAVITDLKLKQSTKSVPEAVPSTSSDGYESAFEMPPLFDDGVMSDFDTSLATDFSDIGMEWPVIKNEVGSESAAESVDNSAKPQPQRKIKKIKKSESVKIETPAPCAVNKFPWDSDEDSMTETHKEIVPLNEYEELNLLSEINEALRARCDRKSACSLRRMRAKLNVRKIKRQKGLRLFDFDDTVRALLGFSSVDSNAQLAQFRVLDRFQFRRSSATPTHLTHGAKLISQWEPSVFQSPYSGRFLKPYIRRDCESKPLWLSVTNELLRKRNSNHTIDSASIDYCYVQPQHIAALSSLCSQFFWPGVELGEILQYPDFTCVALYKKLIVGFACLTPDVDYNTVYLSFLLTRPEWRRAGIATFMLYHLLQTCTDKDVILHVSATNPAVFLYQKFGFKIEELYQNFYDKYFDITSKECRHAILLRLTR